MRSWKMCCIAVIIGMPVGYWFWIWCSMPDDPLHGAAVGGIGGFITYVFFSPLIQAIRDRME